MQPVIESLVWQRLYYIRNRLRCVSNKEQVSPQKQVVTGIFKSEVKIYNPCYDIKGV